MQPGSDIAAPGRDEVGPEPVGGRVGSRVLAVPSGMSSISAISAAVRPASEASTTARRCSSGRRRSASPAAAASTDVSAAASTAPEAVGGSRTTRSSGSKATVRRAAEHVDREPPADGEHPGVDRRQARIERSGVAPGPLERLLGDVLGELPIAAHRDGQPVHLPLVPADEHGAGVAVAQRDGGQERGIVESVGARSPGDHHRTVRTGGRSGSRKPRGPVPPY